MPTSIRQRREHPAIWATSTSRPSRLQARVSIRIVAGGAGQKVGRDPQQPPPRRPAPLIAELRADSQALANISAVSSPAAHSSRARNQACTVPACRV